MREAIVDCVRNNLQPDNISLTGSRKTPGDFPIPKTPDKACLTSVEVRCELRSFQKSPVHQYRISCIAQTGHDGCFSHVLNPVNLILSSNREEMTVKGAKAHLAIDFDGLSEKLGFASEVGV